MLAAISVRAAEIRSVLFCQKYAMENGYLSEKQGLELEQGASTVSSPRSPTSPVSPTAETGSTWKGRFQDRQIGKEFAQRKFIGGARGAAKRKSGWRASAASSPGS